MFIRSCNRILALSLAIFTLTLVAMISPTGAQAQSLPAIGLSFDKDVYVEHLDVQLNQDFVVYAMAMNLNGGGTVNQQITSMPWVIHQVCCGAVVEIMEVELNPALNHDGHPLAGMVSSSDTCLDQETIWLATLTVRMVVPATEDILWAGGPFGPVTDCDGEVPLFSSLLVTIGLEEGEPTPSETSSWGQIKAVYR